MYPSLRRSDGSLGSYGKRLSPMSPTGSLYPRGEGAHHLAPAPCITGKRGRQIEPRPLWLRPAAEGEDPYRMLTEAQWIKRRMKRIKRQPGETDLQWHRRELLQREFFQHVYHRQQARRVADQIKRRAARR